MGFWGGKEGLGWTFRKICLFIQTSVALALYNIDLEVSQLWQSPAYLAGIFSVSYSIAFFPYPDGKSTVSMLLKIEAVLYKIKFRTNMLFILRGVSFTCILFISVGWSNVWVHSECLHVSKYLCNLNKTVLLKTEI